MGNANSTAAVYNKLSQVLPAVEQDYYGILACWLDKPQKPFSSPKDREQFIYGAITVLSQNGAVNILWHDFRILYSRRQNNRIVARLIAERRGVIEAQVESIEDGKDQAEAFKALRRYVEVQLARILQTVPGAQRGESESAVVGPGAGDPVRRLGGETRIGTRETPAFKMPLPPEAPPSYGKAVKEWQCGENKG